jgi:hypothetical protein
MEPLAKCVGKLWNRWLTKPLVKPAECGGFHFRDVTMFLLDLGFL